MIDSNGFLLSLCTIMVATCMSYYVKSKIEEEDSINKYKNTKKSVTVRFPST